MINKVRSVTDSVREVLALYLVLTIISTTVFTLAEDYPLWECFYWSVMTSTTVGYGDVTPKTKIGEMNAMITAIMGVFAIVPLVIYRMIEMLSVNRDAWTHEEQEQIKIQLSELKDMIRNKS